MEAQGVIRPSGVFFILSHSGELVVARDGRWFRAPQGEVVELDRYGTARRLLVALASARRDAPGVPLSSEQLLKAGWPGENPSLASGRNRVYVAIAQLRSFGLRGVLVRDQGGYLLDPGVAIILAASPERGSAETLAANDQLGSERAPTAASRRFLR
jgi:hypothetical protein